MAQQKKSDAIILHSIRWRESSKIVTIYSRDWGKIGVIAHGALKPKSPFAGNIETLNHIQCILAHKQDRNLQILTGIDVTDSFNALRLDLDKLPYALAISELLYLILEEQEGNPVFFDFTLTIIQSIAKSDRPDIVFWYFLLKFSSFLGFRPQLQKCHACDTENSNTPIRFDLYQGTVYCSDCSANSPGGMDLTHFDWNFLRHLQKHPHQKIHKFPLISDTILNFTPMLMQYLNIHLDKNITLKSLQLLV